MKFIEQKERLFEEFCKYLKSEYAHCNEYKKASIQELWGIILKGKNISTIKKNYEKLIKEDKKEVKNNLIKIQETIHYMGRLDNFDENIFKLEPEFSWAVRIKYACVLAKDNEKNGRNSLDKKRQAIKEFEKAKETIDIFLEDLSSQSTLNKLVFSLFEKNKEKASKKDFKTKIEIQNENRKNFLEVLKSLINTNIETIEKYIGDFKENSTSILETSEDLKIAQIIKRPKEINPDSEQDIEIYMEEFGFETFEILKIVTFPNFLSNLLVFALGILEICAGCIILKFAKSPKLIKLARFLIRQGVSDIYESVKATIDGKEINLKEWGKKKAVEILKFSFELVTGKGADKIIKSKKENIFLDVIKDEIKHAIKKYANTWLTEKIIRKIEKKIQ